MQEEGGLLPRHLVVTTSSHWNRLGRGGGREQAGYEVTVQASGMGWVVGSGWVGEISQT